MFGIAKWGVIAAVFAWTVTSYGPMLGLSDSQVQQVSATVDSVATNAMTPEQINEAQSTLKQVTPTPEELQAKAQAITPIILGKIDEGKAALLDKVTKMREGMTKQP